MFKTTAALLLSATLLTSFSAQAVTETQINLNVRHDTNGDDTFERERFITIHASLNENDLKGEEDKIAYLVNDLDVYFGRDNGSMAWQINQSEEDPNRPGYVDPSWMSSTGKYQREVVWGQNSTHLHPYEKNENLMIGGQPHIQIPGHQTTPCCGGTAWTVANGDAIGEFMGLYLNEFYRDPGHPSTQGHERPEYLEILNEPLWELVTTGNWQPIEVFNLHNDIAQGIRRFNSDVKIGGYTTAFPIFEENNFQRWHDRMKLFVDTSGDYMDYFSLHFYDFNNKGNADKAGYDSPDNFKGSRIEATLDMLENYSKITLGETKPLLISEYGGRDHSLEGKPWTPQRDWVFMKSMTPLMMTFLDRPDQILKTIPFITTKATWGSVDGVPYNWRLLRQQHEAEGEEGDDWVFTEQVKLYQLWQGVDGTRVDSRSTNPDVMLNTYVNGNTAWVVLANLNPQSEQVFLNYFESNDIAPQSIQVRHLYADSNGVPKLDTFALDNNQPMLTLAGEASAIIKLTFANDLEINQTSNETKYYAKEYLQPIQAGQTLSFNINGVQTSTYGEAIIRIGLGREHGLSLMPEVWLNDTQVTLETEIQGDDQNQRAAFFGLLKVPVAMALLQSNNEIKIRFADSGGHVSSVTMQAYEFTDDIRNKVAQVQNVVIAQQTQIMATGSQSQLEAHALPFYAQDKTLSFVSSDPTIAHVDNNGLVTAVSPGTVSITATSTNGISDSANIEVENPVPASISFDNKSHYLNTEFINTQNISVNINYNAGTGYAINSSQSGITYRLRELRSDWTPVNDVVVTDTTVIGQQRGTSSVNIPLAGITPSSELEEGHFYFLFVSFSSTSGATQSISASPIKIIDDPTAIQASLKLDDPSIYLNQSYPSGEEIQITTQFHAGTGQTVSSELNGIQYMLRQMRPDWTVVKDYLANDQSVIGQLKGTSSASISLQDVPATADLPAGHFYFLFVRFIDSNGNQVNTAGLQPIKIESAPIPTGITLNNRESLLNNDYLVNSTLPLELSFSAGQGQTVTDDLNGIKIMLRHLNANWVPVKDIVVDQSSVIGQQSGQITVNVPLNDVTPSAELESGHFYFLFIRFTSSDGTVYQTTLRPISILADPNQIEPFIALDNKSTYLTTEYISGASMRVTTEFNAGTHNTVAPQSGGIKYFLRELNSQFQAINDIIVYDTQAIGLNSGNSSVAIPLTGLTPSDQLAEGHFYYLYVLFESSTGEQYSIAGDAFPIQILADFDLDGIADKYDSDDDNDGVLDSNDTFPLNIELGLLGDFDLDGDVDRRDLALFVRYIRDPQKHHVEFDFDGDGRVHRNDVNKLRDLCTRVRCAE